MENKKDISLVYMVAGVSSRFGGRIKAFAQVGPNGETLIEYSLGQALPIGFTKIVFIVSPLTAEPFKALFGDNYKGVPVQYALQSFDPDKRDRPWGTAQAISTLKSHVSDSFVVCNGDDIYGDEAFRILYNHLENKVGATTVGYKLIDNLSVKGTSNRGIIKCAENGKVLSIEEVLEIDPQNLEVKGLKPDDLASMNFFGFENSIIDVLAKRFEDFKLQNSNDRKVEIFLPTEVSDMIQKGELEMIAYPANGKTIGLTYPEDEVLVKKLLSN
ncbi:MAG: sugar phosphate nucleotidyltransferase [Candidatus Paceibacterota bacterium]|jgi:dTDP-glucose pyrophosphorylase